ncbi:MAG: type II toxin-antitoxin system HicB family antitoxin [Actinobacteria bacterium]|nr:type II toxin-antitoxin system HicB family antitoxin [Cyanobacteriota bacterium]MCL6088291.1 type II toxin-antitoxin system HicB family antitoxin [Actinomycetota bacterium]
MENHKIIEKYTYRVEWSEEDQLHIARCLEFPSLAAHGDTAEGALKEIEKVVEEVVAWMQEENEEIPQPFGLKRYKGNLTLRIPPEVHRNLSIKSAEEGVSINQYILSKIS